WREAEVRITRLFTPHEREPRETGRGYIYFFPGGRTEHAVVQITDGEDNVYSIEVHALTGRAEIHAYAHEPVELDDESELRDPG
ncbi:MAG TPA: prepilin-type cleavage/methylation domain-containing protein, partial [Polyangiaceae bacterium LLY-WYZ-15_(1-7)]|nr:prepilin-type cleavage/methylation domain-containing protein [Polyangiaceae bacterium LLY-WYZ-15_(1-7)]